LKISDTRFITLMGATIPSSFTPLPLSAHSAAPVPP
jgi:hypothetical protein